MTAPTLFLLLQLASTLPLVGLIWTIQLVHYPLFRDVGEPGFARYHAAHSRRISLLVMPLMLVELGAATASVVAVDAAAASPLGPSAARWSLLAVALIWLSTFVLSVPLHGKLGQGFEATSHRALVASNWLRTAIWTARGALLIAVTAAALR